MNDDGLDRFLERTRPPLPAGLADRVVAGLHDPAVAARYDREEVVAAARKALLVSLIVLAIACAVLAYALFHGHASPTPVADEPLTALVKQSWINVEEM
jgi:hypothetical protein